MTMIGGVKNAARRKTNGRCWYCGREEADSLEHQLPVTRGGERNFENCVISCRSCNSRKATRTVEEFRTYMMVAHGRPPAPFFGEPPATERDWIIVCDTPLRFVPAETMAERMAIYDQATTTGPAQ
jgi:hypothetical protein